MGICDPADDWADERELMMMKYFRHFAAVGAASLLAVMARGASAATRPSTAAADNLVVLASPKINAQKHEFTIPAAFWNEHVTDWLDVALCGRPSNFLHETALSIQTTRDILKTAFHRIGYHSATEWSPDLSDFGCIRGQPVLILVKFRSPGTDKEQTFLLDELIEFRAWHVSVGPFGWLYLGTHDPYGAAAGPRPRAGQRVDPAVILANDPQAAMQFRGIQHASQSLLDFPLCFDNWIYPNIRYHRNVAVLAMKVFDSNGKVPVRLVVRRVSEVQYLQAAEKYWHDPAFATYIQPQLPVAKAIDAARRKLWHWIHTKHLSWTNWRVERCVAQLQDGYARLQAAWVVWDVAHAHFRAANNLSAAQVRAQAKLFLSHLQQLAQSDHQQWLATQAFDQLQQLKKSPTKANATAIRQLQSAELAARSQALLDSNGQDLAFWQLKKQRLKPNDPRKIWIRDVESQYALAVAQKAMGEAGLAYAAAMKAGAAEKSQSQYLAAILQVSLAKEKVALVNVEFHISNDQGFVSAGHMASLKAKKAAILKQINLIIGQLKKMKG